MRNVQERVIAAPADKVGALLERCPDPKGGIWPSPAWPPLLLDRGLDIGSSGGHDKVPYAVAAYEPGRRLRFQFAPGFGLDGYHEFVVTPLDATSCRLTHIIQARSVGTMLLLWPLAVRWLHEALLKDLLDNAEREATGGLSGEPERWSPWVRLMHQAAGPRR